ncbi:hypothetical protein [Microvirga sp. M2]|uniref:hypothetical protein n=1 Tax=Microvirga sp. M2 TaxID=3073270 RepID=UPI0039C2A238
MHSHVEFREDVPWGGRYAALVYRDEVDGGEGRIAVLSPEGAAPIGLGGGQSIMWWAPSGWRSLTPLRVLRELQGRTTEPRKESP